MLDQANTAAPTETWIQTRCLEIGNRVMILTTLVLLLNSADLSAQYSGPEFGSILGGETVSTGEFMDLSVPTSSDREKVRMVSRPRSCSRRERLIM